MISKILLPVLLLQIAALSQALVSAGFHNAIRGSSAWPTLPSSFGACIPKLYYSNEEGMMSRTTPVFRICRPGARRPSCGVRPERTSLGAVFKTFDEMLSKYRNRAVLVTWNAKNCGGCKLMKKELKIVRETLGERVLIFNLDSERFPSLGARFDIAGLPTAVLFKGGEPVHRIEGVETSNEIIRQVQEFL
uniref:Thioredoxin domain-containing protein n=1 Tax=Pseudictyota dubia TaxID=2749911 RepID=A0A7R9W0I0_9STRA